MAFPSVVTPRGTSGALGAATSVVVAMPASATTARGVLVVFSADSAPTVTTSSTGWTRLNGIGHSTFVSSTVFWKRPGVTLTTLTVNLSISEEGSYVVLAVDGASPSEDPYLAGIAASGTNTDPPNLTPSGGARDYLWIAARSNESTTVASAAPASFTNLTTATGGASGASTATSERELNAASLNPGAFTSATEDAIAWTIAIPPGVADQSITVGGIASGESVGSLTLAAAAVGTTPGGVPSGEAVGSPQLTTSVSVSATGVASAEAIGSPTVTIGGVVAATGVPSAEAVGTPAVTAGAVAVTGTGVPSAEAVGTPSLALSVTSAGVASAEAVGTPALTVGPAVVTTAGVASGEVVPAPVVLAGAIAVGTAGVPSAEAVPAPRVSMSVFVVGVPSTAAVGSPSLTVGAIAIFLTGVASAEAVGTPDLTVTLDPTKRIRPVRARLVPLYEVLVVGRVPAQSGPPTFLEVDLIDWSKLRWSSTLSRPQTAAVTCKTSTVSEEIKQRLRGPDRQPTELWVSRNGRRVFAGPVLGGGRNGDELTLQCGGLLTYLQVMIVEQDLRFDQVDQFAITAALIDQWQDNAAPGASHGHFGIDTSGVGESGVLRDRSYVRDEGHYVSRRVEELGAVRDGFDIEVDPTTRKLQLWYPGKGVDRSTGDDAIVFDGRNIDDQNGMFSIAPGDLASDAFGSGSKSGGESTLWSAQVNPDLRAAYGRAAVMGSWSDVEEQGTLDDHVGGLLDARDQPLRAPGQKVRVPVDADLDAYAEGDTVAYELDDLLGIGGAYRIRSRTVDVEQTGVESVDLEFV